MTAQDISQLVNGQIEGNPDIIITGPAKIEEGKPGNITFLANMKYEKYLYTSEASVFLIPNNFSPSESVKGTLIKVDNVYEAVGKLLAHFGGSSRRFEGISHQAIIGKNVKIGADCHIGAFAYIEDEVKIGNNVTIYPQAYIGNGTIIGDNTIIYPGVKIYHQCIVGARCILHANAVIGSDGFGYSKNEAGHYIKVSQIGNVIIHDHVEIGANTVIDRATMGSTIIREGVKLDNLIQIAHNVEVGQHTVMAAQTGIAGSTKIGSNSQFGGQVGIVGHLTIADGAAVQAQSGIASSIKKENAKLFGTPAIDYHRFLRSFAIFKRLPELLDRIRSLEKKTNPNQD